MLDRIFVVQTLSNFGNHEEAARRSKTRPLFEKGSAQYGKAERGYLYDWNVRQEASDILVGAGKDDMTNGNGVTTNGCLDVSQMSC